MNKGAVRTVVAWSAAAVAIVAWWGSSSRPDSISAAEQRPGGQDLTIVDRPSRLPQLAEVEVSRQLGTAEGPEMLGFRPLGVTPYEGGFIVADGRDVRVVGVQDTARQGVVGRRGEGPSEYRSPIFTRTARQGIWVFDYSQRRALRYESRDSVSDLLTMRHLGPFHDAVFLPSGELVVSALGATRETLGMRLHVFSFEDREWSHHMPELRDQTFSASDRRLIRRLEVLPDGRLLVIDPDQHVLQVVDPALEFRTISTVQLRGGWGERMASSAEESPPRILDVHSVSPSEVCVLSGIMEDSAQARALQRQMGASDERSSGEEDRARDSVVECLDLETGRFLSSATLDEYSAWILGRNEVGHYVGAIPFPRFEVLRWNPS